MPLLYSIHDRDAHPLIPSGGWCVDAVLVTDQPPHYSQIRRDINWIVRLNHGWHPNGTIPVRSGYEEYAKRCADFANRAKGVGHFIISNEPNHMQEQPHGVAISPEDYADCFNLCYEAVKRAAPHAQILVAAVAPWDISSGMDWLAYYARMLNVIDVCDGFAVHGYTHGADPGLVWNTDKSHGWYWHFPVIYQTIEMIPGRFSHLPVHVTETDQGDHAWADRNTGWVQEAYASVEGYNGLEGSQKIHSLSLYRWRGDKYELYNKQGVQDDFRAAVAKGYESPGGGRPPVTEPPPNPGTTPPWPEQPELSLDRDVDPALLARGVEFDFVSPPAGTGYWRMTSAQWLDEAEADAAGPDHHILGNILRNGSIAPDVPFKVTWPTGFTTIKSKQDQPNVEYNYDFPMSSSLNEFSIWVDDGSLTDRVSGIGMGMNGNPSIHTSTWINWEWAIAAGVNPQPPIDPEPGPGPTPPAKGAALLWPVSGPITHLFGQGEAVFGQAGHGGIDIGVPTGTQVLAVADGEVVFTGTDQNYGYYVRVWHPQHHFHSFYAHLSQIKVKAGARVQRGQMLALSGHSGNVKPPGPRGSHLHLEFRGGTRDAYYNVTFGYTQGRFDPRAAYLLTGAPLEPGAAR